MQQRAGEAGQRRARGRAPPRGAPTAPAGPRGPAPRAQSRRPRGRRRPRGARRRTPRVAHAQCACRARRPGVTGAEAHAVRQAQLHQSAPRSQFAAAPQTRALPLLPALPVTRYCSGTFQGCVHSCRNTFRAVRGPARPGGMPGKLAPSPAQAGCDMQALPSPARPARAAHPQTRARLLSQTLADASGAGACWRSSRYRCPRCSAPQRLAQEAAARATPPHSSTRSGPAFSASRRHSGSAPAPVPPPAAPAPAPAPAPACLAADRARSRLCENTGASCQQHGAALQALIPGRMHLRAVASVTASNPCIALSRPSSNALRPVSGQRQPECFGAVHRCHAGSPCTAAAGGRTRERGAQHAHQALHARGAEEKAQRGDAQLRAQRRQRGVRVLRHLPAAQPRRVGHAAGCRYQRMLAAVSLLCTRTAQTSS